MRRLALAALVACRTHHGIQAPAATAEVPPPSPPRAPVDPPPFPPLRGDAIATPLAIARGPIQKLGTCRYEARTASDPALVDRQLVIHCNAARAVAMAIAGDDVTITPFSQQGNDPWLRIGATGALTLLPPGSRDTVFLPPNAPSPPPGWNVVDGDGSSIFATNYNQGLELMRGTLDHGTWKFAPAFAARFPAKGLFYWPVFLHHPTGEPTIVYVTDPQKQIDVTVRLPGGATIVALPTWPAGAPSDYRIANLSAVELPGQPLPVIAAKADRSIVVAYPTGPTTYATRAFTGAPAFAPQPPAPSTPPHCSEAVATRDREEVFDPHVVAWNGTTLAFLSTRVHEQLRWTLVPIAGKTPAEDRAICDWIVDQRTSAGELVLMHLEADTATEVARIPVDYAPGDGFHGAGLIVEVAGNVLHAIATSYGTITYTRVRVPIVHGA